MRNCLLPDLALCPSKVYMKISFYFILFCFNRLHKGAFVHVQYLLLATHMSVDVCSGQEGYVH